MKIVRDLARGCPPLGGSRYIEIYMYGEFNPCNQVYQLYKGCPLLRRSVMGSSTLISFRVNFHVASQLD